MATERVDRPRRLRRTAAIRDMVRETRLTPSDFILPLFVRPGRDEQRPVASMPGVFQWSADRIAEPAGAAWERGVKSVLLFGIPDHKDAQGSAMLNPRGVVPAAIRSVKEAVPEMVVMTDLCLCDYTDHGHCGLLAPDGSVDNDRSVDRLVEAALVFARAGADVIAPSDMMDGRVGAIREALEEDGFTNTLLLSYAVKYASSLYAPFREAAENRPAFGDRRGYQMDPANRREARREAALDEQEGADLLMVKPALPYLDILADLRDATDLPVAAYQVSGEYSLIKAGGLQGWVDGDAVALETLLAIRRAGADLILTYFATEAAGWLGG